MGDFFSSGSSGQQDQSGTTAPWSAQAPYLQNAFGYAQDAYNKQQNTPFYQGSLYASLNPQQLGALGGLNNFASNGGAATANAMTSAGNSAAPSLGTAANGYSSILNQTQQDPTQSIINSAGQYANNPNVKGMIDAANRPIEQQLNEQQLPQLNLAAAGSGNTDSSRAGVTEAIMRRNAGTQEADNAANITGNAWNTGLNTAAGLYGTNLSGALGAAGGAANVGTAGLGALGQGYQTNLNNLNIPLQTGTLQQQDQQGQNEAAYTQWQGQMAQPWNTLNNYMGIVGNRPWGSVSTGTGSGSQTANPSGMQDMQSVFGFLSDPRLKVGEDGNEIGSSGGFKSASAMDGDNGFTGGDSGSSPFDFLQQLLAQNKSKQPSANMAAGGAAASPGMGTFAAAPPNPVQGLKMGGLDTFANNWGSGGSGGSGGGGGSGGLMGLASMFGSFFSDPRMKVVGGKTKGALYALDHIDIKKARYKWDKPGTERPMMMADQVQSVLPSAVTGSPGGAQPQMIKGNDLMPVMIGAIKELHEKVNRKQRK
jgi:hypothetical protein